MSLLLSKDGLGQNSPLPSVTIGNQTWTSENLDVSVFRNGDTIPQARSKEDWLRASFREEPIWCYFGFDESLSYLGRIYNYYAFSSPKNIAPKGWRIPGIDDFLELIKFLDPINPDIHSPDVKSHAGGMLIAPTAPKFFNEKPIDGWGWSIPYRDEELSRIRESYRDAANTFFSNCRTSTSGFNAIPIGSYRPSVDYCRQEWGNFNRAVFWCITDWEYLFDKYDLGPVPQEASTRAVSARIRDCSMDFYEDDVINGYSIRVIAE